jgi:hypothetical protein
VRHGEGVRRVKPQASAVAGPPSSPRGPLRRLWARVRRSANEDPAASFGRAPRDAGEHDSSVRRDAAGACAVLDPHRRLVAGSYVTDGRWLFRIEHSYADRRTGTRVLELENCTTMELSVWSFDDLASRSLRSVIAMDASKLAAAIFESELGRPVDELVIDDSERPRR